MIALLWTYAVTGELQRFRLRECAGHGWVEVWRGDELEGLCFADDLHPERIPPVHQWIDGGSNEQPEPLHPARLFE